MKDFIFWISYCALTKVSPNNSLIAWIYFSFQVAVSQRGWGVQDSLGPLGTSPAAAGTPRIGCSAPRPRAIGELQGGDPTASLEKSSIAPALSEKGTPLRCYRSYMRRGSCSNSCSFLDNLTLTLLQVHCTMDLFHPLLPSSCISAMLFPSEGFRAEGETKTWCLSPMAASIRWLHKISHSSAKSSHPLPCPGFQGPLGSSCISQGREKKLINIKECPSVIFTVLKTANCVKNKWFHFICLPKYLKKGRENVHFTLELNKSYCR